MAQLDSFLPRIRCVFYATFDHDQGPKVPYQVPEGSIITSTGSGSSHAGSSAAATTSRHRPSLSLVSRHSKDASLHPSPSPSSANRSGRTGRTGRFQRQQSTPTLFEFDSISEFIIPKDQLCHRVVRCNTPSHRIIGYPVKLTGPRYQHRLHPGRDSFHYNVCFVFDRTADLSCYEPIVRKCGQVLLACEQESGFLSQPDSAQRIQPILEQLFEELNSFSETSIPIDSFNSIELQIFPFYPNPPKVHAWQVPVPLLNLEKRKEPNWDLSMAKITPFIDGVNHVQRIADLADVSLEIACLCVEHLLFYQCVILIDIFQYSNMYTLKANFQWLADEPGVQEECSAYVTRPGFDPVPLADLLHLYSHLKPGKTLHTWIEDHDLLSRGLGIDVQRFITFGVIKGFLRRVHRWPVLLAKDRSMLIERNSSGFGVGVGDDPAAIGYSRAGSTTPTATAATTAAGGTGVMPAAGDTALVSGQVGQLQDGAFGRERRGSTASRMNAPAGGNANTNTNTIPSIYPTIPWKSMQQAVSPPTSVPLGPSQSNTSTTTTSNALAPSSITAINVPNTNTSSGPGSTLRPSLNNKERPSFLRTETNDKILEQLAPLLDGSRHTDELCTLFRINWRELEKRLIEVGEGDYEFAREDRLGLEGGREERMGRVRIIYR